MKLLMQTRVHKQPATMPFRIVLYYHKGKNELIVWDEIFSEDGLFRGRVHGAYFTAERPNPRNVMEQAMDEFYRRAKKQMCHGWGRILDPSEDPEFEDMGFYDNVPEIHDPS